MVYRPTPKTRARKEAQRVALLDAARTLLSEGGFAAASVQAVATRANVATGTVYRHFPSKAELFVEVFSSASAHEVQVMAEAASIDATAREQLKVGIRTWASRALEGRTLAYALIAEPVMPEVEAARLRFRRAYVDVLQTILQRGCDRGEFSLPDVSVAAAAIVGALAEALVGPLSVGDDASPERRAAVVEALTHFCLQAVTPSRSS